MKLFLILLILFLIPKVLADCIPVEMEMKKETYNLSEKITFTPKTEGEIRYWIEDEFGNMIKKPVITANKNPKSFTPKKEGIFFIKSVLTKCNQTNSMKIEIGNPRPLVEISELIPLKKERKESIPLEITGSETDLNGASVADLEEVYASSGEQAKRKVFMLLGVLVIIGVGYGIKRKSNHRSVRVSRRARR